jgi:hypothetical protein
MLDVYADHVRLSPRLRLPKRLELAQRYVAAYDRDLRLRRSAENPHVYVLERRCRRRPAVNTAMRDWSDLHIQARDGYIHVASVHPNLLARPWTIIAELREHGRDSWDAGGADKVLDEVEYEKQLTKEARRRRRYQMFRDMALEHFDLLDRHGNPDGTERTRVSNAGTERSPQVAA